MMISIDSKYLMMCFLFFLLFATPIFAQANVTTNSTKYCLDNTVLAIETERVICIEGQCDNVERVWNTICEHGCDETRDQCYADPIVRYGFVALVIIVIIAVLILGWKYL